MSAWRWVTIEQADWKYFGTLCKWVRELPRGDTQTCRYLRVGTAHLPSRQKGTSWWKWAPNNITNPRLLTGLELCANECVSSHAEIHKPAGTYGKVLQGYFLAIRGPTDESGLRTTSPIIGCSLTWNYVQMSPAPTRRYTNLQVPMGRYC